MTTTALDGAKIADLVYQSLTKGAKNTHLGLAYTVFDFYTDQPPIYKWHYCKLERYTSSTFEVLHLLNLPHF